MAFILNNLTGIRPFGGQMMYGYATNDTKAGIETAGYFNNASSYLQVGDIIVVSGDIDGTPFHASYIVSSNTGGVVALTAHSAITQNVFQEVQAQKISSKASDAEVFRYVPTFAGSISNFRSILNAALATGNATATLAINGTNVTNGALTLTQAGSAAGDVATVNPSALNTFAAGDKITITVGGASTATATVNFSLKLTPS